MRSGRDRGRVRRARRLGVPLVVALTVIARAAGAQFQSASILFFPRVIADGDRDTVIQIGNTFNTQVRAACSYLQPNGAAVTYTQFPVFLAAQQFTHWVASRGRPNVDSDPPCSASSSDCDGAGLDPGPVPAVATSFHGALVCVEVAPYGEPIPGNHIVGQASVEGHNGEVASYNAIGLQGFPDILSGDKVLCLGNSGATDDCPMGPEYSGCPMQWLLNHVVDGAPDSVAGTESSVATRLTVLSCSEDLASGSLPGVTLQISMTDEFGTTLTASTKVAGWSEFSLVDANPVFSRSSVGSDFVQTRIRPVGAGIVIVADELHSGGGAQPFSTAVAINPTADGERATGDIIRLPQ